MTHNVPEKTSMNFLSIFTILLGKIDQYLDNEFIQEPMQLSDDVSLKKLLKEKSREKKSTDFSYEGGCEAAEVQMERLCKAKDRLESMMQKLQKFRNNKTRKSDKTPLVEQAVIYVPVAELREKAC